MPEVRILDIQIERSPPRGYFFDVEGKLTENPPKWKAVVTFEWCGDLPDEMRSIIERCKNDT